jgi:hypothetical protein
MVIGKLVGFCHFLEICLVSVLTYGSHIGEQVNTIIHLTDEPKMKYFSSYRLIWDLAVQLVSGT